MALAINDVVIKTTSKADYIAALNLVKVISNGTLIPDVADGKYWKSHPYVGLSGCLVTSFAQTHHGIKTYNYDNVGELLRDLYADISASVKLNADYTAVITKDQVVVGCQTFPISKMKEIMDAHKALIK